MALIEDAGDLVGRKGDAFAEAVDGIDEALCMRLLQAGQDDLGDVIAVAALVFRRRRMGAEIGGDDTDRAGIFQRAGSLQHLHFGFDVEAVAGLHLDRGDAFGKQRIEARQGCRDEVIDG